MIILILKNNQKSKNQNKKLKTKFFLRIGYLLLLLFNNNIVSIPFLRRVIIRTVKNILKTIDMEHFSLHNEAIEEGKLWSRL